MKTYITRTWKFYTSGVEGKSKCKVCGKTITKNFSTEYREDSVPDLTNCKQRKEKWEQEEHVCLSCMKKSLVTGGEDITHKYDEQFKQLHDIHEQIQKLKEQANVIAKDIDKQLDNRIVKYNDNEYAINNVSFNDDNCWGYEIWATPVNKKQPWYKKFNDRDLQFINTYGQKDFKYYNHIDISTEAYTIIDEDFSLRLQNLNKWLKEME